MANKPRSIFEEVDTASAKPQAVSKVEPKNQAPQAPKIWLWLLFALVVVMVLVGGLTRLTDSGLSITEWNLVFGTLPPLSEAAWLSEFEKYKQTQEFTQINAAMTIAEFKGIYWWEWGHRLLGRVIGMVWIIGFLLFWLRGQIRRDRVRSLFILGVLIGLQGVIGILMVKSGYIGARVDVASYALATHLGMAFVILGLIFWNIKLLAKTPAELVEMRRRSSPNYLKRLRLIGALVFLQIILGALVAGIDAGRSYTDWPLMGGEFFSSDSFMLTPFWKNFFENPALVQFLHRMNGYLLVFMSLWFWLSTRQASYKQWRFAGMHFLLAILIQVTLGIVTLIHGAPIYEAIVHQGVAIGVWILVVSMNFAFHYPRPQSLRD